MNIVLINPPLSKVTKTRLGPVAENLFYNSAPLGLAYLGSFLGMHNHRVKIIDAAVEKLSVDEIIDRISEFSVDFIGLTTFTVSIESAYCLAEAVKSKLRNVPIIAGGPHITSNPEDLIKNRQIDFAVIGEGEVTFKELIDALSYGKDLSSVKGLSYKDEGRLTFTGPRGYIQNLDMLPYPARHLLPMHLYIPQPNDQRYLPKFSMITSRGCPYSCIFCDKNVFGNFYRSFSPEYIVNEMSHLVKELKARDIAFVDSTFTLNRGRVLNIINEIKKANLDVSWTCSARADVLDKELLLAMKNAGCWRVRLGIESGNEEILKFIQKGISKERIEQVSKWAYELDLSPKGFFMIGHMTDTKETIEETISFAVSLPLKDITVQINTPLKNTYQYAMVDKYGKLKARDYANYSFWEAVFIPSGMTEKELNHYYRKFYLKFYLRPVIWYRHIKSIRNLSDITKYFRGIKIICFFMMLWIKERSK